MVSPPSGLCQWRGLRGFFSICVTLILATVCARTEPAPASPHRFLGKHSANAVRRKPALLIRRTKSPPFFRSEGVRSGVEQEALGELGDNGDKVDSTMDRSLVLGSSMAYDFNILDNLEPTAPMDRLHAALGKDSDYGGHWLNPIYVPPYLNPDAFPTVAGKGCNCSMATAANPKIECSCGENGADAHYTWLKDTPVLGTNNYTLEPADITYPSGDYWGPKTKDGLIAPADVLPTKKYPNQALADRIWPLPVSAADDRIGIRFSRYMDQVNARAAECDTISEKCTVPCKPGDEVIVVEGNLIFKGKIIKAFVGNAMQVEFAVSPGDMNAETDSTDCPIETTCSAFRYCKKPDEALCTTHLKDKDHHNWKGDIVRKHVCPDGYKVCKTVNEIVMASMLKKGGKACKAAAR